MLLVKTVLSCCIIELCHVSTQSTLPVSMHLWWRALRCADSEGDWSEYMQQMSLFKAGDRDYVKIRDKMGPIVYPAGFVYVFSGLHLLTDGGENIRRGQYIFLGFTL